MRDDYDSLTPTISCVYSCITGYSPLVIHGGGGSGVLPIVTNAVSGKWQGHYSSGAVQTLSGNYCSFYREYPALMMGSIQDPSGGGNPIHEEAIQTEMCLEIWVILHIQS